MCAPENSSKSKAPKPPAPPVRTCPIIARSVCENGSHNITIAENKKAGVLLLTRIAGRTRSELYALANSFNRALPLRNHGLSRLCMYRGNVRFFARSFCNHSRASSRRFPVFRKLA